MFDPFIIAEIGVNHEGDMITAKRMIDDAIKGGADAVKFQVYKAESLAVNNSPAYWDTTKEPCETQKTLFSKYDGLNPEHYRELAEYCKGRIEFMVTPFDVDDVGWLSELVKRWKIASADITNIPLLRAVRASGKPVILSTGAAGYGEIETALNELGSADLLHCVLNYPTEEMDANLYRIKLLKATYPCLTVGYSDHVCGTIQLDMAVFMGAEIIEKHFTDDKTKTGNDHYHSMDKHDLRAFKDRLASYRSMYKNSEDSETQARLNARRSIVAKRDISAGETLSADNLTVKRPCDGIPASDWDKLIGLQVAYPLTKDTKLEWWML